jgi:type II secretory pathway component GspD/PulD (secretin)
MTERQADVPEPSSKKISVVSDGMTVGAFARQVATEADVSIVVEEALDARIVTVDVRSEPVDVVLGVVARRLGVDLSRQGSLFFVGTIKPEDKGVLVRRVTRLPASEVKKAIATLATETQNAVVDVDGLVVVADRIQVLRRVHDLIDGINAASTRTWVVQLYVVGMSKRAVEDLGVELNPTFSVRGSIAAPGGSSLSMEAALDALLTYESFRGDVNTVASPTFVLRDGVPSRVFVGDRIPVPRRSVSDQGTVSTLDFEQVEAGLGIDCEVREAGRSEAILTISIERSRIKGTVEGSPILGSENFETTAVVGRRGVYMLGELSRQDDDYGEGGVWRLGDRGVQSSDLIQVWARVDTVGSDMTGRRDLSSGPQGPSPSPAFTPVSPVQREASPAAMSGSIKQSGEAGSNRVLGTVGERPALSPPLAVSGAQGPTVPKTPPNDAAASGGWRSVPSVPPGERNDGRIQREGSIESPLLAP